MRDFTLSDDCSYEEYIENVKLEIERKQKQVDKLNQEINEIDVEMTKFDTAILVQYLKKSFDRDALLEEKETLIQFINGY